MRYLALLRGINVGGRNMIRMADLKACFEAQGFSDVATYIQSGNVLFTAGQGARARLAARVEDVLSTTFAYRASVVLRSGKQMADVVGKAPAGFGSDPARFRYDVLFLGERLTAKAALPEVPAREGVDEVHAGVGVLYYSRLVSKAAQSGLNRLPTRPVYRNMTIRNWNTTTALRRMMEG